MYNYIHYYYTDNAPNNNMALAFMAVVRLSLCRNWGASLSVL